MLIEQHDTATQTLRPFGVCITSHSHHSLASFSAIKLKQYLQHYKLILFRGFKSFNKEEMLIYARSLGQLLEWSSGPVMEMKVDNDKRNYLFTHGAVPFHWDGAFYKVPSYLFFHCIQAPPPSSGGQTLFTDTETIYNATNQREQNSWKKIKLSYETEKLAHYGGKVECELVHLHPEKNSPILRFAEPVPDHYLNPVSVKVLGMSIRNSERFIHDLATRLYDQSVCYSHQWEENDFVIADNYSLVHGRNAFNEFSPRHLRRIQLLSIN